MKSDVVQRAVAAYGLDSDTIASAQGGYRSQVYPVVTRTGDRLCIIFYKSERGIVEKIRLANRVSNGLSHILPTRRTADDRILKLQAGETIRYGSLYHYLPGQTIAWESYGQDHIKLLGKALGQLHAAMRQLERGLAPSVSELASGQRVEMQTYFRDSGVREAMRRKLRLRLPSETWTVFSRTVLQPVGREQLLHMDFVRGNILFSSSTGTTQSLQEGSVRLSGILDFEKVAWGSPLHDLARTLAFLLVDCKYKTERQVRKYFLQSGYNKRGGQTIADTAVLDDLAGFYLLHDLYKFLRHNPYEALTNNEHYVRTRDFLLQRSLVEAI